MKGRFACCVRTAAASAEAQKHIVVCVEYTPMPPLPPGAAVHLHVHNQTRLCAWEAREMAFHPASGAFVCAFPAPFAAGNDVFACAFVCGTATDDCGGAYYRCVARPDDDDDNGLQCPPALCDDDWQIIVQQQHHDDDDDSLVIGSTPPSLPASPSSASWRAFTPRTLLSRFFGRPRSTQI